jgi:L-2-amino-thiazoline-4-carboxylic acid hydrolase
MQQLAYLERVKIQCEILLPLYRRLRDELGNEKAATLLRAAVRDFAAGLGRDLKNNNTGTSLEKLLTMMPVFAAGNALDVEPLVNDAKTLDLNVRRCEYAKYFHAMGEAEFGAMVTCEIDHPMTDAIGSDLSLKRTQTIMSGGNHCDFRWKME